METTQVNTTIIETVAIDSAALGRSITIDCYLEGAPNETADCALLLINDGQDLAGMPFDRLLHNFLVANPAKPLLVAGIHGGADRMNEYGVAAGPDYLGRGAKAVLYEQCIVEEAIPYLRNYFPRLHFTEIAIAGFSLGGLSAFDMAWNHPELFSRTGVFSGSLWWRSKNRDDKDFDQHTHRMIHRQVRESSYRPGMKFFFQCGEQDEREDRNRNGVIDSIDDAIDLMKELIRKGYREGPDIEYLQLRDGKHTLESWARAIPVFLKWGWAISR